jgi:hypothetical protein
MSGLSSSEEPVFPGDSTAPVWHRLGVNLPAEPAPQQSDADPPSGPLHIDPTPVPVHSTVDRRTLDEVFGQVLPETTSDERDERAGRSGTSDDWFYENRPPHHDH